MQLSTGSELPAPSGSRGLPISDDQRPTVGARASPRSRGSLTPDEQRSTDPEVRELHRSHGSRIPDNDQRPTNPEVPAPLGSHRSLTPDEQRQTDPEVRVLHRSGGLLISDAQQPTVGVRASSRSHRSPTLGEQRPTDPEVRELHRSSGSRIPDNDPRQTNPEVPTPLRSHGLPISDEQPSTLGVHTSPRSRGSLTLDEQRPIDPEVPVRSRRSLTPDERQSTGPEVPAPCSFEDACRRIDDVAEVMRPSVPSPRSDHSIQGARIWKTRIEK